MSPSLVGPVPEASAVPTPQPTYAPAPTSATPPAYLAAPVYPAAPAATPVYPAAPAAVTVPAARTAFQRRYLMCRPDYFTVSYSINPWMQPEVPTNTATALMQWHALYDTYRALGHEVYLIDPIPGLPDMVYTANGGLVIGARAYAPKFRHAERADEAPVFMDWFQRNGFEVIWPREVNEGEGDFLLVGDVILAGTGFRSAGTSHREVQEAFGREVISLTLVDPRFYHLDTAITVLDPVQGGAGVARANIAYYPQAFDLVSRSTLAARFPDAIQVTDADQAAFALNATSDGRNVIVPPWATGFAEQLRQRGYTPIGVDLSELVRGGGGIKCCTLELRI